MTDHPQPLTITTTDLSDLPNTAAVIDHYLGIIYIHHTPPDPYTPSDRRRRAAADLNAIAE